MGLKDMLQLGNIGKTGTLLAHQQKMSAQFDIMFQMARGFYQLKQKGYPHTQPIYKQILNIFGERFQDNIKQKGSLFTELQLSLINQVEDHQSVLIQKKALLLLRDKDETIHEKSKPKELWDTLIELKNRNFPGAEDLYQTIIESVKNPHELSDQKRWAEFNDSIHAALNKNLLSKIKKLDFLSQLNNKLEALSNQGNQEADKIQKDLQRVTINPLQIAHYRKIHSLNKKIDSILKEKYPEAELQEKTTVDLNDLLSEITDLKGQQYPGAENLFNKTLKLLKEIDPSLSIENGFTDTIISKLHQIQTDRSLENTASQKKIQSVLKDIEKLKVIKKKQDLLNNLRKKEDPKIVEIDKEMQEIQEDFLLQSYFQDLSNNPSLYEKKKNQFLHKAIQNGNTTLGLTNRLMNHDKLNLHETSQLNKIQKELFEVQETLLNGSDMSDRLKDRLKKSLLDLWEISHGAAKNDTDIKRRQDAIPSQITTFQRSVERMKINVESHDKTNELQRKIKKLEKEIKQLYFQRSVIIDQSKTNPQERPKYLTFIKSENEHAYTEINKELKDLLNEYQDYHHQLLIGRLPKESIEKILSTVPAIFEENNRIFLSKIALSENQEKYDENLKQYIEVVQPISDSLISDMKHESIRSFIIDATNVEAIGTSNKGNVTLDSIQRELLDRFSDIESRKRSSEEGHNGLTIEQYQKEVQEIISEDLYHHINNSFKEVTSQFNEKFLTIIQKTPEAISELHPHLIGFLSALQTALSTTHVFGITPEALDLVARISSITVMEPDNALTKFTAGLICNISHPEWVTRALEQAAGTLASLPQHTPQSTATLEAPEKAISEKLVSESDMTPKIKNIQQLWDKRIPPKVLKELMEIGIESGSGSLVEQMFIWCNDLIRLQGFSEKLSNGELSEKEVIEFFNQNKKAMSEMTNLSTTSHPITSADEFVSLLKTPEKIIGLLESRMATFPGSPRLVGKTEVIEHCKNKNHINSPALTYLLEQNLKEHLKIDLGKNSRGILLTATVNANLSTVVIDELRKIRLKLQSKEKEEKERQENKEKAEAERGKATASSPGFMARTLGMVGTGLSAAGKFAASTVKTAATTATSIGASLAGDLIIAEKLYTKAGIIISGDEFHSLLKNIFTTQEVNLNAHSCLILSQQLQKLGIYTTAREIYSIANTREGLVKFIIDKLGSVAPKTLNEKSLKEALETKDSFANFLFQIQQEWTGIDLNMSEIKALQELHRTTHSAEDELGFVSAFQSSVLEKVAIKISKALETEGGIEILPTDIKKSMKNLYKTMFASLQPQAMTPASDSSTPKQNIAEQLKIALKRKNPEPWRPQSDVQTRIQTEMLCGLHQKTEGFLKQFQQGLTVLLQKNKRLNSRKDLTEALIKTERFIEQYSAQNKLKQEIENLYQKLITEHPGITIQHLLRSKIEGKVLQEMIANYDKNAARLFQESALMVYSTAQASFLDKEPEVRTLMCVANLAICSLYSVNGTLDTLTQAKTVAIQRNILPDLSQKFSHIFGRTGEQIEPALSNIMGQLASHATDRMTQSQLLFFKHTVNQLSGNLSGNLSIRRELAEANTSFLTTVWEAIKSLLGKMGIMYQTETARKTGPYLPQQKVQSTQKGDTVVVKSETEKAIIPIDNSVTPDIRPRKHPGR